MMGGSLSGRARLGSFSFMGLFGEVIDRHDQKLISDKYAIQKI